MKATKLLKRSSTNKTISGVCGGVGEYFDIDPVVIRVVFVILTLFTGIIPGVIAYFLFAAIIPESGK